MLRTIVQEREIPLYIHVHEISDIPTLARLLIIAGECCGIHCDGNLVCVGNTACQKPCSCCGKAAFVAEQSRRPRRASGPFIPPWWPNRALRGTYMYVHQQYCTTFVTEVVWGSFNTTCGHFMLLLSLYDSSNYVYVHSWCLHTSSKGYLICQLWLFYTTASTTVSLSSSLEGNDHGGGACPGEVVVFTCVVSSTVIDWRVPSLDITAVRTGGTLYKTITVGPFEFNGTSLINDTLTSTATVDASEVADNTQIICVDGNSESSVNETSVLRSVGEVSVENALCTLDWWVDNMVLLWYGTKLHQNICVVNGSVENALCTLDWWVDNMVLLWYGTRLHQNVCVANSMKVCVHPCLLLL